MKVELTKKTPTWKAAGTEPSQELQEGGFTAGYKPPAGYFNFLFNGLTEAMAELQSSLNGKDFLETSSRGAARGVASLDADGHVPEEQLALAIDKLRAYVQKTEIGTAASKDTEYFATAAQGKKADSSIQEISVGGRVQSAPGGKVSLPAYPTTLPASDVSAWAKAPNKPEYTPAEIGVIGTAPTSGQVAVFDGISGKIKSTGFTIASSVPAGAKFTDTVFKHPGHTAYPAKLYIMAVDELGHVSSAREVVKKDITDLGVPEQDTRYNLATPTTNGLMSAADKGKLDGIAPGANNYTLPVAGAGLGGVKTTSTVTNTSGYIPVPIVGGVPYYKDTNTTYSDATATAHGLLTAADYKKLQKFTEAEAGYLSGVTGSIQTQLNGKAPSSHGHPISGITGLQSALDGKAPSSHGTHVSYGAAAPKAPGTASAGSSANVSREDHTHPVQTSVSGNAGSAAKLQTPRTINGTNFDGSAPITTANWGTARNVTIGNSKKSVNGAADVSWTLSEIGALPSGGTAVNASKVTNSIIVKLNNGTIEGTDMFTFNGAAAKSINITPSGIGAAAKSKKSEIIVSSSAWIAEGDKFKAVVSFTGITTSNGIEVIPSNSMTDEQMEACASADIRKITQAAGSIILYAYGGKPEINFPLTVIIRGDL